MATFPSSDLIPNLLMQIETRVGLEEADTTPPEDTENIEKWVDQAGSNDMLADDLDQEGFKPWWDASTFNSLGHARMNLAKERCFKSQNQNPLDTPIDTTACTIICVFQVTTNQAQHIWRMDNPVFDHALYETAGGAFVVGDTGPVVIQAVSDTNPHLLTLRFRGGATSSYRLDNGTDTAANFGVGGVNVTFYIGRDGAHGNHPDLNFVAFIVYDRVLSDVEVRRIEFYLDDTYALGFGLTDPDAVGEGTLLGVGAFLSDG